MHRVAAGFPRHRDQAGNIQIRRHAAPFQHPRFIGAAGVQRRRIVLGMHRDGRNSHGSGGARDTDRDLATVGDQEFPNGHGRNFLGTGGLDADATDTERNGSAAFGRSMVRANRFNPLVCFAESYRLISGPSIEAGEPTEV